jgi:hypothetical protein
VRPTWIVYCHTHIESGRRYIGLTKKTLLQRWNQHLYKSKRPRKSHFWNAIRKYGKEAFSHEVLQTCSTLRLANRAEVRWIERYKTRDPLFGFNLARGGDSRPNFPGQNPWDRPDYRAKSLPGLIARTHTPQSRANSRAAVQSPEVRAKISALFKGKAPHPRTLQAARASHRARYESKIYINCKLHGRVLLRDCYRNKRRGKSDFFQCKQCSKDRVARSKQRRSDTEPRISP